MIAMIDFMLAILGAVLLALVALVRRTFASLNPSCSRDQREIQQTQITTQSQLSPGYRFDLETQKRQYEHEFTMQRARHEHEVERKGQLAAIDREVREYDLEELKIRQAHDSMTRQHFVMEMRANHAIDMAVRKQELVELEARHIIDMAVRAQGLLEMEAKHRHEIASQAFEMRRPNENVDCSSSWCPTSKVNAIQEARGRRLAQRLTALSSFMWWADGDPEDAVEGVHRS